MSELDQKTQQKSMTRKDLEARIIAKAWKDPSFKDRLINYPKATLQAELHDLDSKITLPDNLNVSVHEEDANNYHLVLPRNPKDISLGEVIDDNDLEAVAPQTIAVVVLAAVAVNTVGAANNVGAVNAVAAGNVATTGNAVANYNTVS